MALAISLAPLRVVCVLELRLKPMLRDSLVPRLDSEHVSRRCSVDLTTRDMGRYRKRGMNMSGDVANEVESEQIVHRSHDSTGLAGSYAAFVQFRGSVPLFWTQETSVANPRPDIEFTMLDPTFSVTRRHFAGLVTRYEHPVRVLSLLKLAERNPRETKLSSTFKMAVKYLNKTLPRECQIKFEAIDLAAET
jgi:phosphatidylinositol 3,5-bisphosphate 5-phosphatase